MTSVISIAKEIRLFIAFMMTLGGTSVLNWELTMYYISTYHIHLVIFIIIGNYTNHYFSNSRHKKNEEIQNRLHKKNEDVQREQQEQIRIILLENSRRQVIGEVKQAYKDYENIEVIYFISAIKYLNALNEKRIELKINSYTEDMMMELLKKIKL